MTRARHLLAATIVSALATPTARRAAGPDIVISQVYGGGNAGRRAGAQVSVPK